MKTFLLFVLTALAVILGCYMGVAFCLLGMGVIMFAPR